MVQFEESVCSETERIYWHMMSTGSSAILRAIFLELYKELRPALERNTARSHALLVHTGVPSNRGIPERAGQPFGTVPVDPEPSRVGRNYLHLLCAYICLKNNCKCTEGDLQICLELHTCMLSSLLSTNTNFLFVTCMLVFTNICVFVNISFSVCKTKSHL